MSDDYHRFKHDGEKPSPIRDFRGTGPRFKAMLCPFRLKLAERIAFDPTCVRGVPRVIPYPHVGIGMWEALDYGAAKYERYSWREVPDAVHRYTDALLRHFLWRVYYPRDRDGHDAESGLHHDAHAAASAAIVADLLTRP